LLQFANNVFWWLVVAAVQLGWTVLVGERYVDENPSAAFIDVCTVAKVSLLIMDQRYHGFYLHANAPHEHADGSMAELGEHLFEEAAAMRVGRGLPGCPDPACQTFELHVPALWREMYDRVYRRLVDSETAAVNAMFAGPGGQGAAQLQALQQQRALSPAGASMPSASTSLTAVSSFARVRERTRRLGAGFAALSAFVRGFIEETDPDYRRVWRERTLVQQLFDLPPDMLTEGLAAAGGVSTLSPAQGGSAAGRLTYMLRDPGYRFERVIFRGIELDLLVWDILVYCFTDYWQQSPAIAAVVTYVVATAVAWARTRLGQRNIAYKTLIDERFLK
jgi:meckelin